jgi:hypothetical protein
VPKLDIQDCRFVSLDQRPDVSAQYEKFNRTELEDSALQLEEPVWGQDVELLKR